MYHLREKQKTIFPLLVDAERPDLAAASLLEGRVIVMVDGSPFCVIAPSSFYKACIHQMTFYESIYRFVFRIIRAVSFIISLFIPALYLCIEMFHSN